MVKTHKFDLTGLRHLRSASQTYNIGFCTIVHRCVVVNLAKSAQVSTIIPAFIDAVYINMDCSFPQCLERTFDVTCLENVASCSALSRRQPSQNTEIEYSGISFSPRYLPIADFFFLDQGYYTTLTLSIIHAIFLRTAAAPHAPQHTAGITGIPKVLPVAVQSSIMQVRRK